jgi:hypothetical protein
MARLNTHHRRSERTLPARFALASIELYRRFVSPVMGAHCRFQPTCSAYAHEAIERHGLWVGSLLSVRRLSRCHPFEWLGGSHGFDPVPKTVEHRPVKAPNA